MNQNIMSSANNNGNALKPLKYPGLGLFMSFKLFFEIMVYIVRCFFRGFTFVFKDLPVNAWQKASGQVDKAYKGTKIALEKQEEKKKKSVLNMDIGDLLKNTKFMQKKIAKLEKEKLNLYKELEGDGKIRSKESRVFRFVDIIFAIYR